MALLLLYFIFWGFLYPAAQKNEQDIAKIPYHSGGIITDGNDIDWGNYIEFTFSDTLSFYRLTGDFKYNLLFDSSFDTSRVKKPRSKNKVYLKSCWDMQNLYFYIVVQDKQLYGEFEYSEKEPRLQWNDGLEIFIDSKDDSGLKMDINDFQFMFDILGSEIDFHGDRGEIYADTVAVPKIYDHDILQYFYVNHEGTINDDSDSDTGYTMEIAIPFASIGIIPEPGMEMAIDIGINDVDYFDNGLSDISKFPLNNWTFSWSGYSDFGYPKYWKSFQLTGEPSWFEQLSEGIKTLLFVFMIIIIIALLITMIYLSKKINIINNFPTEKEIEKRNVVFIFNNPQTEDLSYNAGIIKLISEFVTDNKDKMVTAGDAANKAGISLRKLQRITKEEMGITPTNYIYIVKLQLAADFIKSKRGNITEAAFKFGFSDPAYFSKLFKKHFGLPPSEFQKKYS